MVSRTKYPPPDRDTMTRMAATMNDRQISKIYGCSSAIVARWRDLYGLPRSPRQSGGNTIRWQTNRAYFTQVDTPEKAYILGFLIADGHIHKSGYKVDVSVKEADAGLLRKIAEETGCDAPLKTMINHYDGSAMKRLLLCGRQLVTDLNDLGLYHDKSRTATWPTVAPELESHLARGIWDGDGHIGPRMFDLIGTPALLDGLTASVQRHTGCALRRRMSGRDRAYHYAYGTRRDTPALDWMYSGASITLERKREKVLQFWSQVPRA